MSESRWNVAGHSNDLWEARVRVCDEVDRFDIQVELRRTGQSEWQKYVNHDALQELVDEAPELERMLSLARAGNQECLEKAARLLYGNLQDWAIQGRLGILAQGFEDKYLPRGAMGHQGMVVPSNQLGQNAEFIFKSLEQMGYKWKGDKGIARWDHHSGAWITDLEIRSNIFRGIEWVLALAGKRITDATSKNGVVPVIRSYSPQAPCLGSCPEGGQPVINKYKSISTIPPGTPYNVVVDEIVNFPSTSAVFKDRYEVPVPEDFVASAESWVVEVVVDNGDGTVIVEHIPDQVCRTRIRYSLQTMALIKKVS